MKTCRVTIIRTITTVVEIKAKTLKSAKDCVVTYGLIEAVSDFPVIEETVDARVVKVMAP